MSIREISSLLDALPIGRSTYEFENIYLDQCPTMARRLVAAMEELEILYAEQLQLTEQINNTTCDGEKIILHRKIAKSRQQYEQLKTWYDSIDKRDKDHFLRQYENEESEYWANYLGRQAALELITLQHTTKQTMDKMSLLPVEAFEEAVRICIRYSTLIKDVTVSVENSMSASVEGTPSVTDQ